MNLNELIEKIGPFITSNAEVLAFVAAVVATILVLVLLFRLNAGSQPSQQVPAKPSTATAPIDKPVTAAPLKSPLAKGDDQSAAAAKPEKQATAIAEQFAPSAPSLTRSSPAAAQAPKPAPVKPQPVASSELQTIEAELIALKALFKDGHISAQIYALKAQQIARKLSSA